MERVLDSSHSLLFSALILVAVSLSLFVMIRIAIQTLEKKVKASLDEQLNKNIQTLTHIAQLTQTQLHQINETIDNKLTILRTDNERKLEQIRHTVDDQLQQTLERRLGESFKLVSEQLTTVNKSLGEMRNLADGVGDLKRVLSNVKARGIWGEFQLHSILKEVLSVEQYATNVATKKGSNERVEFVIKLPGSTPGTHVLLPIDAKFPKEDYERLIDAQRTNEVEKIESIRKAIRLRIKGEAKDISTKYINVPTTTDFAILFLPLEGLYAEVLQHPGFVEELQTTYRVTIAGPTTLMALLNSLQMGFRTLSIQKHSSEVWQILSTVKSEFVQFGLLLDKTKKRLDLASTDLSLASKRSEKIQRTLVSVETNGAEAHEEIEENTK